jgi:hypothetical protein
MRNRVRKAFVLGLTMGIVFIQGVTVATAHHVGAQEPRTDAMDDTVHNGEGDDFIPVGFPEDGFPWDDAGGIRGGEGDRPDILEEDLDIY